MSNEIREQLSALMDGELPRDQVRFLLRRVDTDDQLASTWMRYQLASSVLRRTAVLPLRADFAENDDVARRFHREIQLARRVTHPNVCRVFEAGVTEAAGPSPRVFAQLGKGPAGSDPRTSANWTWSPVGYNRQVDNNDEYQSALQANTPGTYAYTYRFSLDSGPYTYCDLDGAGENPGLAFDPAQLGMLTVTP